MILHIACLTDPPKTFGKNNLTLLRLPSAIQEQKLQKEVQELVDEAVSKSHFARDWRNRRYAHRDLDLALNRSVRSLPKANIQKVETVLEAFRAALNRVKSHYFKATDKYEGFIAVDDAEALLHYLRVAANAEDRREKRFREGRPLPEDLEPPPEI